MKVRSHDPITPPDNVEKIFVYSRYYPENFILIS